MSLPKPSARLAAAWADVQLAWLMTHEKAHKMNTLNEIVTLVETLVSGMVAPVKAEFDALKGEVSQLKAQLSDAMAKGADETAAADEAMATAKARVEAALAPLAAMVPAPVVVAAEHSPDDAPVVA